MDKNTTITENNQHVLFNISPVMDKKIELSFTGEEISSDGGLLLLKECEKQTGIIKAISECLTDDRHQSYVKYSYNEMITQR